MPTFREIAKHFGFKSTRAVSDHIRALEKKGKVRCHARRSRGIELLNAIRLVQPDTVSIPVMGDIPAGCPEQTTAFEDDPLAVDATLLDGAAHHRLFALRVNGDSMAGRGIFTGDWVIADADADPLENNIVVALIDGRNTLKTLARKKSRFYLKAEHPDHPDWMPADELIIQGVAKTIIRQIS